MNRTLHTLRASIALGAILMACAAPTQAADTAAQRVAMACTHGSDAAGCKAAPMLVTRQAVAQRADMAVAKAPLRRANDARSEQRHNDGSRFTYDSCGCSN